MFNMISYQGNTNQNHSDVPLHTNIAKKPDNNICGEGFREVRILIYF